MYFRFLVPPIQDETEERLKDLLEPIGSNYYIYVLSIARAPFKLYFDNNEGRICRAVLTEPIQSLSVSPEFKKMARANGFNTIQDILDNSLDKLHELPYSGYRMLKELSDVLEANGLNNLLED